MNEERKEFIDLLSKVYLGDREAFYEIVKKYDSLYESADYWFKKYKTLKGGSDV